MKSIPPPLRQTALRAETEQRFTQGRESRHLVAPIHHPSQSRCPMRIARQIGNQLLPQRQCMALPVMVQKLDFHFCHVNTGRAFALAALARHAQIHRGVKFIGRKCVRTELTGDREPQRVGPAARQMLLLAGGAERRAHGAGVELAAMPVVVAHLDRLGEAVPAMLRVALVFGPVEHGVDFLRRIVRLVAEQRAVVHFRGAHDFARVEQPPRVEEVLDFLERARDARPEHRRDPFRAHQPVAVFARISAFVLAHHRAGFLGDRAHFLRAVRAHVEDGPHVQAADRGVRVPGAPGAVLLEHLGQAVGIFGEVLERHRAVFDERHGFAVAFHRHHDVEPRLAHFPDVALQRAVGDFDHASRQPEFTH